MIPEGKAYVILQMCF